MSGKSLVLAIDCDDVLIPTAPAIINYYNFHYGTNLRLEHMYRPASLDTWGTEDDDIAIERVNEFLHSKEHEALAPSPEAVRAVRILAKQHELHLVTGRASFLESVTQRMLEDHFGGCFQTVEHTNFITASNNKAVRRTKGEVCRTIGADLLIDDHVHHGQSVLGAHLRKVIVFGNYPWNQQAELMDGMVRCEDWQATLEEVDRGAHG